MGILLYDVSLSTTTSLHSCNDKTLNDFLKGKPEYNISLFWHFVRQYQQPGKVTVHPTKSMIALAAKTRIDHTARSRKDFVDVTFPFYKPCNDNLCFPKIAQVPGQQQFDHHFQMHRKEDGNKERLTL